MARLKSFTVSQASVSNAAGATTTGTSVDLRGMEDPVAYTKITNGATGPTVAASATVQVSPDSTNWYDFVTVTAGTVSNAVASWAHVLPKAALYARIVFSGNTVQPVTVTAGISAYANVNL